MNPPDSSSTTIIELLQIITDLLKSLAWPVTIYVIIKIYEKEIRTLLNERFTGLQLGDISIDLSGVKKTENIVLNTESIEDAAKNILSQQLVNEKEKRIIRALIDETQGRGLYSYQKSDYYRESLASLSYKKLIELKDNKYFLTNIGQAVAKEYIHQLFDAQSN